MTEAKNHNRNSFSATLEKHGLELKRAHTDVLQINTGLLCDLACRHCHLEAGPLRTEVMTRQTMDDVIAFATRNRCAMIDITGGAPELVADLDYLLERLAPLTDKLIVRTNLTAIDSAQRERLLEFYQRFRIALVASFPSTNAGQADAQRGTGVHAKGVAALQRLNRLGYGQPGTGLELDLVANPSGAFLPSGQQELEARFKRDLLRKHDVVFNRLFTFANAPLGRFRAWLQSSGNECDYLDKLVSQFNPAAIEGLMCRSLLSVAWDGYLFDCDFNQAAGIGMQNKRIHISELETLPAPGTEIMTDEHCYACTAGAGFT